MGTKIFLLNFKGEFMTKIIKMLLLLEDWVWRSRRVLLVLFLMFLWLKGKNVSQKLRDHNVNSSSHLSPLLLWRRKVVVVLGDCSATRSGNVSTLAQIITDAVKVYLPQTLNLCLADYKLRGIFERQQAIPVT